jgi:hypothetical protein
MCLSWNNIYLFLFYVPPKMSSRTPGGTHTPGWIPLHWRIENNKPDFNWHTNRKRFTVPGLVFRIPDDGHSPKTQ